MTAGPKLVADRTEHGAEAGRVPEALEPLQTVLTSPDGLMRILDAVVLAPVAEMGDGWQRDGFRGRIARQPIGHDGARYHLDPLQEFAKEPLRRSGAPMALHQDVEYLTRVIDRPPQPTALPIDHQTEFIEVPDVRTGAPRAPQASGVLQTEPERPEPDGFIRDLDAASKHQFRDVAQAHPETVVEPHAMTNDLGRKAVAFIERGSRRRLGHGGIRADRRRLDNASPSLGE
jgi:hypothetical protein